MDLTDYDGHDKDNPEKRQDEALTEPEWLDVSSGAAPPNGFVVSESTTSTLNEIMMALRAPTAVERCCVPYVGPNGGDLANRARLQWQTPARSAPSEEETANSRCGPTSILTACQAVDLAARSPVVDAVTTPNIIRLGVYGSSKAKKGAVVEKITRRVKRDNLFDVIVTASVMKKPDLKKIQAELGNMLGLQLRGEKTSKGRARLLCGKIKTVGRILIILDDVWGEINLAKIGIPFGNDHMGCKILLISETQNVLSNQTDAQIKFLV